MQSLLFTLITLLVPISAIGFEAFPEFESLTEVEETSFDTPTKISREYTSDLISFTRPLAWESLWLQTDTAFELSLGSLSGDAFLTDNRAKFHKYLSDIWQFRFTYFDQRNYETESIHHIVELIYWPNPSIGFSTYFEFSRYKREDDLGFAILYRPQLNHEIRLFFTFVDFIRTERNDRTDRFLAHHEPFAYGLVGRFYATTKRDFFEYAFRYETEAHWFFPEQFYEYHYGKKHFSLAFQKFIDENQSISGRLEADQKYEGRFKTDAQSTISPQAFKTDRITTFLQTDLLNQGPNSRWNYTAGLAYAYRYWLTDNKSAISRDVMPFVSWQIPTPNQNPDFWKFDYMATIAQNAGDESLRANPIRSQTLEQRINITYEIPFKDNAWLSMGLTFDADLSQGEAFEGGNGRFRASF